jgi:hypothetical protein
MIIFIVGMLLGVLGGGAVCVRYLRHEIAADIGPQLRRMHGKLDNLEAAVNLALMTRYADLSMTQLQPPGPPALRPTPRNDDRLGACSPGGGPPGAVGRPGSCPSTAADRRPRV